MRRLFHIFTVIALAIIAQSSAYAQTSLDLRGGGTYPGGSLIPGYDSVTCDSSIEGAIRYNSSMNCPEYCDGSSWACSGGSAAGGSNPTGCTSPGDTCDDGSVFAGLSTDDYAPMYTTAADAPGTYIWGPNSNLIPDCNDPPPGFNDSCHTGQANTAILAAAGGHDAADYCDGLTANGHDDWYLPAQDELNVLYNNKNSGDLNGTFDESGTFPDGYYTNSSERSSLGVRAQSFNDGSHTVYSKSEALSVRCVRKS